MLAIFRYSTFCSIVIMGVFSMSSAFSLPEKSSWKKVEEETCSFHFSLPQKPHQIELAIPLKNSAETASLKIYSSPLTNQRGIVTFAILSSPAVTDLFLEPSFFKENFFDYLFCYFHSQPTCFIEKQSFTISKQLFQGKPALFFTVCYGSDEERKKIEGIAFVEQEKLYHLFYLDKEEEYEPAVLKMLLQSCFLKK